VLIIEDDREIADLVALHLRDLGLAPELASDGRTGLARALAGDWALIVLDLMLPQLDGLAICRRIREGNPLTPILMLTARSEEEDRILGLELGADEYVTKPFLREVLIHNVERLISERQARSAG
jgi:DNA-binding response OmpR family regulator